MRETLDEFIALAKVRWYCLSSPVSFFFFFVFFRDRSLAVSVCSAVLLLLLWGSRTYAGLESYICCTGRSARFHGSSFLQAHGVVGVFRLRVFVRTRPPRSWRWHTRYCTQSYRRTVEQSGDTGRNVSCLVRRSPSFFVCVCVCVCDGGLPLGCRLESLWSRKLCVCIAGVDFRVTVEPDVRKRPDPSPLSLPPSRLMDWLIAWSIDCSFDWPIFFLIVWLIDWSIDLFLDWLIDMMWLVGWLLDWHTTVNRLIGLSKWRVCGNRAGKYVGEKCPPLSENCDT